LVEFLIPDELRPKGMMKVEGNITDEKNLPVSAYISVTDLVKNERIFSGRPNADGSYMVYLMEGTHYEMSIDPEQSNVNYFAKQFDLTTDRTPQRERVNVILKEPEAGDELSLDLISFKPYSAELAPESEAELKKLARVVKANPQLKFQIQVVLSGYVQDSTQSDPDLTEIMVDSVTTYVDATDTLGQVYQRDTIVVNTFYHNDRTLQQAESIIAYLIMQGASQDSFTYLGNAIPAMLPEEKKLIVKALVQAN
jgi:SepF-like predicted cell division protein (DUF552 family)